MAILQAATTSSSARVTDQEAVEQLCEAHSFGDITWRLTDDSELSIWGYEALRIYARLDDDTIDFDSGEVTHEFLWKLAEYIEEGDELDIQTAGFTKCRYPVLARRYVVRPDEVLHTGLTGLEPLSDTQPAP